MGELLLTRLVGRLGLGARSKTTSLLPNTKKPYTAPSPPAELNENHSENSNNAELDQSAQSQVRPAGQAVIADVTSDSTNEVSGGQPPDLPETAHNGSAVVNEKDAAPVPKGPRLTRIKNSMKRGLQHTLNAVFHNPVNILLVFVPAGIVIGALDKSPAAVFAINAIAIIPLAGMLTHATEVVAIRLGDTLGALLNVSFGNAVELIIFIIALAKNEIRIVQASVLGSILANLLLILGMAFAVGGLRYREQIYNNTVTQMSACLLSLSVISLLLPTAFHASFQTVAVGDAKTLKVSRGVSVVLLLIYALYLVFQLKTHSYLYQRIPQERIDEESHPGMLHDVINDMLESSSSSSSSSDSSDSDTDSSSGSIHTAGRIRRMFKSRKSRKSVDSRFTTPVSPKSPSAESIQFPPGFDVTYHKQKPMPDDPVSGDELDPDRIHPVEDDSRPRARDFEPSTAASKTSTRASSADSKYRRWKAKLKKHRKHHKKSKEKKKRRKEEKKRKKEEQEGENDADDERVVVPGAARNTSNNAAVNSERRVGFKELDHPAAAGPKGRMSYWVPKLLTENVFVDPNPVAGLPLNRRNSRPQLTKASSLPELKILTTVPGRGLRPSLIQPLSPVRSNRMQSEKADQEPDALVEEHSSDKKGLPLSRTAALVQLAISTGLVAVCAEFMVDAIPKMTANNSSVSETFIGLIILPIVGNAAEHVTAVTVAMKNKMDLAIGVAVGSSIQIALFITPIVVILGWILDKQMSLYFTIFETISLFVTAFVVNFLILDGRSNYLEGTLLMACYVIIAVAAFFYPDSQDASEVGGGARSNVTEAVLATSVKLAARALITGS